MRLAGIDDGTAYGYDGRAVVERRAGDDGETTRLGLDSCVAEAIPRARFAPVGSLPSPDGTSLRWRLVTGEYGWLGRALVGDVATATVHRVSDTDWLATVGRYLFTTHDGGRSWQHRLTLAPSSGPSGVLPSAVCRHEGTLYLGEYPLGDDVPRVLSSSDDGRTWSTALELPGIRHVHAVQRDPFGGDVWLTTGDADDECHIGRFDETGGEMTFDPIGGGTQDWRAIELCFTPDAVLWGVDCGYAAANRLYRLDRDELRAGRSTPTVVGETRNSVYYAATVPVDGASVVAFAAAAETGQDRTNPDAETTGDTVARVYVADSRSGYSEWTVLATFRKRPRPADYLPGVPSANAYVYLAADPETGLYLNPYNTSVANGRVLRVPPDRLPV